MLLEPNLESTPSALYLLATVADSLPSLHQPIPSLHYSTAPLRSLWKTPPIMEGDRSFEACEIEYIPLAAPNVQRSATPELSKSVLTFDERLKRFIPVIPPTPPLDELHDLSLFYAEEINHFGPERKKDSGVELMCPFPKCGREFNRKSNLKSHLATHCTEKPYLCTQSDCKSRFARKHDLTRHK